jgi:hypothetical protein
MRHPDIEHSKRVDKYRQMSLYLPRRTIVKPQPGFLEAELPQELYFKLVSFARRAGRPIESIARQALNEYLATKQ